MGKVALDDWCHKMTAMNTAQDKIRATVEAKGDENESNTTTIGAGKDPAIPGISEDGKCNPHGED